MKTKKRVSASLEGNLYSFRNGKWQEPSFYKIFPNEGRSYSLVQYFTTGAVEPTKIIILEDWKIKKEDPFVLNEKCKVYPFTISRPQETIQLATLSREERRRWVDCLSLSVRQTESCPVDVEAFYDPAIVCNMEYEIVGVNSFMLDFLDRQLLVGKKISTVISSANMHSFTSQCSQIACSDIPPHPHINFEFKLSCRKNSTVQEKDAVLHVSILKKAQQKFFLCQVVSLSSWIHEIGNVGLELLDESCRENVRALLSSLSNLSKECKELRQKSASNPSLATQTTSDTGTASSESPSSAGKDRKDSPKPIIYDKHISVPKLHALKVSSMENIRKVHNALVQVYPQRRKKSIEALAEYQIVSKHKSSVTRTDGFTPRPRATSYLGGRRLSLSVHSNKSFESWNSVPRRVTIIGGGNSLLFGMQLALTGSKVTICEYQQARAEQMNENRWHVLDEMKGASSAISCASLMVDTLDVEKTLTKMRATTDIRGAVKFADIVIVETPWPFDDLFYKQVEEMKNSVVEGLALIFDTNTCEEEDLADILEAVEKLLPQASFLLAMSCGNISDMERQFQRKIGGVLDHNPREDFAIEMLINKAAKEFMRSCSARRLDTLVSSQKNAELALDIGRWLLSSTAKAL